MNINIRSVKNAAEKHLKIENPEVTKLGSGESNTSFLANNKYIIRVNARKTSKNKFSKEFRVLKYLKHYNIAPNIFIKDTSKKYIPLDYMILEYIPGNDLRQTKLSKKIITDVAKLTAKLHNTPIGESIPSFRKTYSSVIQNSKKFINLVNKYKGTNEYKVLNSSLRNLKDKGPKNKQTIAHGDICKQNLIYDENNKLHFIDFENCGISDPAYDIADIFTCFGEDFCKTDKELFLKEYFKHRKDATLLERVEVFIPLKIFETLCWSVMHVFEVKKGLVSRDIQNNQTIQERINYANKFLEKCKELGLVSKKAKLF